MSGPGPRAALSKTDSDWLTVLLLQTQDGDLLSQTAFAAGDMCCCKTGKIDR